MGGLSGHMKHLYEAFDCTVNDIESIIDGLLVNRTIRMTEKIDGYNIHVSWDFDTESMRFFRNAKDVSNGGMSIDDMKVRWKDNPKTLKVYLSAAEVLEDFIKNHKEHFKTSDPNVITTLNVECLYKTTNIIPYLTKGVYIHNFWVWRKEDGIVKPCAIADLDNTLKDDTSHYNGVNVCPIVSIPVNFNNQLKYIAKTYISEFWNLIVDSMGSSIPATDITLKNYYYIKFVKYCDKNITWLKNVPLSIFVEVFNRVFLDEKTMSLNELAKAYGSNSDKFKDWLKNESVTVKETCMYEMKLFFARFANFILANIKGYINYENRYIISDVIYRKYKLKLEQLGEHYDHKKPHTMRYNIRFIKDIGEQINPLEGVVFSFYGNDYKLTGTFAPLNRLMWM